MANPLSSDAEAFIAKIIAEGFFETREAVLERCVASLRAELGDIPIVPAEHMEGVEAGFDDIENGDFVEFTDEVRERILTNALARAAADRAKAAG